MTNSRRKGKAGELEAAHYLTALFHTPVRRGRQFRGSPDSPDVVGLDGLHVEVKRVEAGNVETWLKQSERDASTEQVPMVLHRRNGDAWKVTIRADDLLRFIDACSDILDKAHAADLSSIVADRQAGAAQADCVGSRCVMAAYTMHDGPSVVTMVDSDGSGRQ
jgi:hypothetical protein